MAESGASGSTIDVSNGTLTLTDYDGGYGRFSDVEPSPRSTAGTHSAAATTAGTAPALFRIDQSATAGAGVNLTLVQGDFSVCNTPRTLYATNQTPVRQLWGQAKGKFTTTARYSSATIRGTTWLTQDRCDGSLTTAVDDIVDVLDLVKQTSVALNPGQSYLAQPKAKQAFKPPAVTHGAARGQTLATIRKRGLQWAGQLFVSRAQFTDWLAQRGLTWEQFAARNPKTAAALAARST